jgi:hypothetical protein
MAGALSELIAALDSIQIPYAIGGSLASSAHGVIRATLDGDIVATIFPKQVHSLAERLGKRWYVDIEMIERALARGESFNLIHMDSATKFDIFPARSDFHRTQLERAGVATVLDLRCRVTTAEDILIAELRWYADEGRVSDRQWNDIVGLVATNPDLDHEYVKLWASRLSVSDLLERADADARK